MIRQRVALCSLLVAAACTQEGEGPNVEDSTNPIDQVFAALGQLPVEQAKRVEGQPSAPVTDGDYQCVETPIDEVRQYDQLLGQLNVGDVLWPGAMLRGDSVYSGRLTPITLPRAPLTFSVSLESLGGGARSATLPNPSLSTYRDAVGSILSQSLTGSTTARISAEVEEISSEEQLAVALGADVSAPLVGSVKAGFNFSDQTKRSRYVVKFYQLYYTVDVDPPNLPHDFFAANVTADQVADVVSDTNPPVYVSSIGYGRQVIFTFESNLSKSEVQAALEFVYKGGAAIEGKTSLTHQEVLSYTHTTAFILGGDASEAASVAIGNYDQLKQFLTRGGNYSASSPGAPIAYKLSYVRDHSPVQVSYASAFTQRTCSRISQKIHVVFDKMKVDSAGSGLDADVGGDLEMYGSVVAIGAERKTLSSWPVGGYKQIASGASWPQSGNAGEAIVSVKPQPGQALAIETNLMEDDDLNADDVFGGVLRDSAAFETGWRRTLYVHRSSGDQQVTLQITLTPVP